MLPSSPAPSLYGVCSLLSLFSTLFSFILWQRVGSTPSCLSSTSSPLLRAPLCLQHSQRHHSGMPCQAHHLMWHIREQSCHLTAFLPRAGSGHPSLRWASRPGTLVNSAMRNPCVFSRGKEHFHDLCHRCLGSSWQGIARSLWHALHLKVGAKKAGTLARCLLRPGQRSWTDSLN